MKYRNINLHQRVYVSSSYHHNFSFGVDIYQGDTFKRRKVCWWCYDFGLEPRNLPEYVRSEVERKVKAGIENDMFIYYEYDRDGNTRTEDLRYHDADHVAWIASKL